MKQKTIQEQYILLKEGKIAQVDFLKSAKRQFPGLILNNTSLKDTETILKSHKILNEGYVDLKPISAYEGRKEENFETAFKNFLKEQREDVKADTDKVSKYVEETYNKNYGRDNKSNPNQISFQQFIDGIYSESNNPKNSEKTLEEITELVQKNLDKDFQYYLKNYYKGVEGIGLDQIEDSKEPKGKHASSGYGDLDKDTKSLIKEGKENINENFVQNDSELNGYRESDEPGLLVSVNPEDISSFETWLDQSVFHAEEEGDGVYFFPEAPENFDNLEKFLQIEMAAEDISVQFESQGSIDEEEKFIPHVELHENKNMNLQQKLKEIEKTGVTAALEAKMNAIQEEIDSRQEKINTISENEALADFVDKGQIKVIEKEIKELEKYKAKLEKTLLKSNGGKKPKKQVVDEDEEMVNDERVEEGKYEKLSDDELIDLFDKREYNHPQDEVDISDEMFRRGMIDDEDDDAYGKAYDEKDFEDEGGVNMDNDEDEWYDENEYLGGDHDFKNYPINEGYTNDDKIDFLSQIRYPEEKHLKEFKNLDKLNDNAIQDLFEAYFPKKSKTKILKG